MWRVSHARRIIGCHFTPQSRLGSTAVDDVAGESRPPHHRMSLDSPQEAELYRWWMIQRGGVAPPHLRRVGAGQVLLEQVGNEQHHVGVVAETLARGEVPGATVRCKSSPRGRHRRSSAR